jgi:hypothetical protein
MASVLANYALGADIKLVILAEVLRLLLWMLEAELLRDLLFLVDRGLNLIFMLIQIV